jgi:hypothetical protein
MSSLGWMASPHIYAKGQILITNLSMGHDSGTEKSLMPSSSAAKQVSDDEEPFPLLAFLLVYKR